MTTATANWGHNLLNNSAISQESGYLTDFLKEYFGNLIPASLSWKDSLKAEAQEIFQERQNKNWDMYGALPLTRKSFENAVRIIEALTEDLEEPAIVPQPNGEIGFEWRMGKNMAFSMYCKGGLIFYASIIGIEEYFGKASFGEDLPKPIQDPLSKYFCKKKQLTIDSPSN